MTCTCLYNNTAEGASSIHIADARCPEHGDPTLREACERVADYEKETSTSRARAAEVLSKSPAWQQGISTTAIPKKETSNG